VANTLSFLYEEEDIKGYGAFNAHQKEQSRRRIKDNKLIKRSIKQRKRNK
jgi:hypothetical protein